MSQLHIHAEASDIAPLVLLPGDPNRSSFIAKTFLENPKCYNTHRQLLGYTGLYKGKPISVQTTGMGCPSLAIVVEELIRLGAKVLLRVGTSGIISKDIKPADLIIATSSVPRDGTTKMYLKGENYAPSASFKVTRSLVDAATNLHYQTHVGLIQTEDAFYGTTQEDGLRLEQQGVLAVEMEASALFLLGKLRKVETGCILVASNYVGDPEFIEPKVLQEAVTNMVTVALKALLTFI